jgi:CheY-like chemotaxis protein
VAERARSPRTGLNRSTQQGGRDEMVDPSYTSKDGIAGAIEEGTVLHWTAFGIDAIWVARHLRPACDGFPAPLQYVPAPDQAGGLEDPRQEWAILFLGSEGSEGSEPDGTELEGLVQWVKLKHPLTCLVVVIPSASLGRQLSLMRAGALDVLTLLADDKRIEQTLERATELLEARRRLIEQGKLRLLNQLAVSVNHEINNPLTGLMGTTELLLLESKRLDEKTRRDLKLIMQQCRRIQEVTARLKTLDHLRTVPYGEHDRMIDLVGEIQPPPLEKAAAEPSDQFLPSPSLLVVDDNPLIIDLIVRLFEQNFQIEGATNVAEALKKIERQNYDLVLIDLIMPDMNGLELFRAIRKIRPAQKALLTTGYQGDVRVEQAIVEGALGCVYKPFQLEELEKVLSDALRAGERRDG